MTKKQKTTFDLFSLSFIGIFILITSNSFCQPIAKEILLNGKFDEPKALSAAWSPRSGGLGTFTLKDDSAHPAENKILTIDVHQTSEKPWLMELLQPLSTPIPNGSVLHISFDYKMTPGYIFHFYWQEQRSPWPKLLSLRLTEPVDTWQHLQVAVPVHEPYPINTTAFSFHLAETIGVLQLRNISAKLYPPDTDPKSLTSTITPVLGGDFYDKDWRSAILAKTEETRKTAISIQVQKEKKVIPNAKIHCEQLKNEVQFGVEASGALLKPDIFENQNPTLKKLRNRIEKYADQLPQYQKLVLNNKDFDFISFYDAFIWKEYEQWGHSVAPDILKMAFQAKLSVFGHALFIPAYMFTPTKCRNMNADVLWDALFEHLTSLTQKYASEIKVWDVLHGPIKYNEIYDFIGIDCLPETFHRVHKTDPNIICLISDSDSLGDLSISSLHDFQELILWLKNENVQLDGVSLQANFNNLNVAPQTMEKRLAEFANAIQLPIHIRNFAVNEEKEDVQADMTQDFLLLFYAEPAVASISLGELWSPALLNPRLGYYNADGTPKAAALTAKRLIQDTWKASVDGITAEDGAFQTSVYNGKYKITITYKDQIISRNIDTKDIDPEKPIVFYLN